VRFAHLDGGTQHSPIEIFTGITYGRERLEPNSEGSGLLHWARVDLSAPGIGLYITPSDPAAIAQGWQYRVRRVGTIVEKEHLALAVNGALFTAQSILRRPILPGALARTVTTLVADGVVNFVGDDVALLWFDDRLGPHLEPSRPLARAALQRAKWGVGADGIGLWNGEVSANNALTPDARTAIAIDPQRRLLFLAVGESISSRLLFQKLANVGAKDGTLLDGGHSSAMVIGTGAQGIRSSAVYGDWWPVATQFGVRAKPLPTAN
jgi:hypothetical protein